jgi:hypothetical protein
MKIDETNKSHGRQFEELNRIKTATQLLQGLNNILKIADMGGEPSGYMWLRRLFPTA